LKNCGVQTITDLNICPIFDIFETKLRKKWDQKLQKRRFLPLFYGPVCCTLEFLLLLLKEALKFWPKFGTKSFRKVGGLELDSENRS